MDRTTTWLGRLGASALVAGLAVLVVVLGSPAGQAATVVMSYSSIDNPTGFAVIAELDAIAAGSAPAAIVGSTTATGVAATGSGAAGLVTSAGWAGVPVAIGGALAIGVAGVAAAQFYVPKTSTTLVQTAGSEPGWNGPQTFTGFGWLTATGTFAGVAVYGSYLGSSVVLDGVMRLSYPQATVGSYYEDGGRRTEVRGYCTNLATGAPAFDYVMAGEDMTGNIVWQAYDRTFNLHNVALNCPAGTGFDHVSFSFMLANTGSLPAAVSVGSTYFPLGHVSYTPGGPSGLTGTLVTTVDCGGPTSTRTFSTSVAATSAGGEVPLEWPGVTCAPGEALGHFIVEWVTSGDTQTVYEYTAPSWVPNLPVEFPGCVDGGCHVELWKIVSGSPSLFCGVAAVGCPEWWADSGKADHFQCRYGPYTAPLGLCGVFRKPGVVSPNTTIRVDPVTGVVTGTAEPIISTDPVAFVGTPPVPDPVPNPKPIPWPGPVPGVDPVGPSTDTSSGCFPHGYGIFNPMEWVYRPLVCAFVPPAGSLDASVMVIRDGVSNRPPFSIIAPGVALVHGVFAVAGGTGCGFGDFLPMADPNLTIVCEQPESWGPVYVVSTVVIWLTALWSAVRMVAAGLGNREASE